MSRHQRSPAADCDPCHARWPGLRVLMGRVSVSVPCWARNHPDFPFLVSVLLLKAPGSPVTLSFFSLRTSSPESPATSPAPKASMKVNKTQGPETRGEGDADGLRQALGGTQRPRSPPASRSFSGALLAGEGAEHSPWPFLRRESLPRGQEGADSNVPGWRGAWRACVWVISGTKPSGNLGGGGVCRPLLTPSSHT